MLADIKEDCVLVIKATVGAVVLLLVCDDLGYLRDLFCYVCRSKCRYRLKHYLLCISSSKRKYTIQRRVHLQARG